MRMTHLNAANLVPGMDHSHSLGAQLTVQPRLVNAAHEFEAQLMKELMTPLTSGVAPGDDEDDNEDSGTGSTGALGEFASEALARALSEQGGFGIANKIITQLSQRGAASLSGPETKLTRTIGNGQAKSARKPLR